MTSTTPPGRSFIRPDASARDVRRALVKYIEATFDASDWAYLGLELGEEDTITSHPRLLRSLRFGDDDYRQWVIEMVPYLLGCTSYRREADQLEEAGSLPHLRNIEKVIDLEPWLRANEPELHARLFGGSHQAVIEQLQAAADPLSIPEIGRHARRIQDGLSEDPAQAIGSSKELLESVFKAILGLHGNGRETLVDLPKLQHKVNEKLGLSPGGVKAGDPGASQRRNIAGALNTLVMAAAELRNGGFGTGHGGSRRLELDRATAQLAVTSAVALAIFYAELFHQRTLPAAQEANFQRW